MAVLGVYVAVCTIGMGTVAVVLVALSQQLRDARTELAAHRRVERLVTSTR